MESPTVAEHRRCQPRGFAFKLNTSLFVITHAMAAVVAIIIIFITMT